MFFLLDQKEPIPIAIGTRKGHRSARQTGRSTATFSGSRAALRIGSSQRRC